MNCTKTPLISLYRNTIWDMIGGILGLIVSWTYVSTSWIGPFDQNAIFDGLYWETYLWMGLTLLIGIFLIPRTIGMMYTPAIFLLPIAFLISLIRHSFTYALSQVLLGLAGWGITLLIGKYRPKSALEILLRQPAHIALRIVIM